MSEALAILGYVIGGFAAIAALLGISYGVLLVICALSDAIARDDDIAAHASGMDEFSAPEGGREW
jgi:hypothetical protein